MSDISISIRSDDLIVQIENNDITVTIAESPIVIVLSSAASELHFLNSYASDADAASDGLPVGGAYWAASGHETSPEGTLLRRTI